MEKDMKNIFANRYHDTSKAGRGFWRLMLAWQGSVFKLIWVELMAFLVAYFFLSLLYRQCLIFDPVHKEYFELICIYASRFTGKIPVTFMTGFYVANVVSRYWDQFVSLPWPDRLAFKIVTFIPGKDDYSRTLRRTVMRYINLSTLLVFRLVSSKVRNRFPGYTSIVEADLMTPNEAVILAEIDSRTPHETTWAPMLWASNLLERERTSGRMKIDPPIFANLISSFEYLENCNRRIFNHGWVNFPLAYTQVATLIVYTYLFSNLFGHQYLTPTLPSEYFKQINATIVDSRNPYFAHTPVVYFPYFTILEFIGYLGWIKVAETLLNPWGDDDEDFQINYLIDRNFQTSYFIVDEAVCELGLPPDPFMAKARPVPPQLPYRDAKKSNQKTRKLGRNGWTKKYSTLHPVIQLRHHFERQNSNDAVTVVGVTAVGGDDKNDAGDDSERRSTTSSTSPFVKNSPEPTVSFKTLNELEQRVAALSS